MSAYVIAKTRRRNQSELEPYAKQAPSFMACHSATCLYVPGISACFAENSPKSTGT